MEVWNFIQNQILGMRWLNVIIGNLLSRLGLDLESRLGGSLHFFFYDVIKIFILLSVLIFGISYIQSYFPPERTKQILSKFRGISANIFAALLGTVTPFCSCSSIPLFIGFTSAGLPVGITFSFFDFLSTGRSWFFDFDYQHFRTSNCRGLCHCWIGIGCVGWSSD